MPTYDITNDQWVTPPTDDLHNRPTHAWLKRYAKLWGPVTRIRYYDYQSCDCPKCGHWEEMGIDDPRANFTCFQFNHDYENPKFKCDNCDNDAQHFCGYEVRAYD